MQAETSLYIKIYLPICNVYMYIISSSYKCIYYSYLP